MVSLYELASPSLRDPECVDASNVLLQCAGQARAINPIALAPHHETKISRVSLCGIAPKVHIDVHADRKRARVNQIDKYL